MSNNIVVFGEVLFDVFSDKKVMGGAPFNFAYHLNAFGLPVKFVSSVGKDDNGKEIANYIENARMSLDGLQQNPSYPTGIVSVKINQNGAPSYTIVEKCAYDYIEYSPSLETLAPKADFVYFGTLAQRNEVTKNTIRKFIKGVSKDAKVFLDLNLRKPFYSDELIKESLGLCNVLKINDDEADILCSILLKKGASEKELVEHLNSKYGVDTIIITKGSEGSSLYCFSDQLELHQKAVKVTELCDTVGAGDSFSSMFVTSLLKGLPYDRAMLNATVFAAEFCKFSGAIPSSLTFYDRFRKDLE